MPEARLERTRKAYRPANRLISPRDVFPSSEMVFLKGRGWVLPEVAVLETMPCKADELRDVNLGAGVVK